MPMSNRAVTDESQREAEVGSSPDRQEGDRRVRVVRVFTGDDVRYGLADDGSITLISDEPFAAWETEESIALLGARLMPPAMPTKIVCVGVNYKKHAAELDHKLPKEPVIFLKPPTSMNATGGEIHIPAGAGRIARCGRWPRRQKSRCHFCANRSRSCRRRKIERGRS